MSRPAAAWTVDQPDGAETSHVIIDLRPPTSTEERDALLTDGVVEAMNALVRAYPAGRPVVIDLRLQGEPGAVEPATEAYVEAIRGLVQSYVLEVPIPVRPVNVLVSSAGQDAERGRTLTYLSSPDGTFSCGATYDFREVRP